MPYAPGPVGRPVADRRRRGPRTTGRATHVVQGASLARRSRAPACAASRRHRARRRARVSVVSV